MIELQISATGELRALQWDSSPTVYLDHWALNEFSKDQMLADRLTAALKARNGTLALSWLNVAEFSQVTMEEQARRVEGFVEANMPRIFFLQVDHSIVIRREDELLAGGPAAPPHGDADFLREFILFERTVGAVDRDPGRLQPFTARGLFRAMQNSGARNFDLVDVVADRIESIRNEVATDPDSQSLIRRSSSGSSIQRGTRIILYELFRALLVDRGTKMNRNHVIDLFHAVVPIAYCDFVLLDKYWVLPGIQWVPG